jgi:hypothetical protein
LHVYTVYKLFTMGGNSGSLAAKLLRLTLSLYFTLNLGVSATGFLSSAAVSVVTILWAREVYSLRRLSEESLFIAMLPLFLILSTEFVEIYF